MNKKRKAGAGRPALTEIEKARRDAARKNNELNELLLAHDLETERIQFHDSENVMGRPSLTPSQKLSRAEKELDKAVAKYRKLEVEEGIEAITDGDLFDMTGLKKKPGRKPGGDVDKLLVFVRRCERDIFDLEEEERLGVVDPADLHVRGRRPIPRSEKIAIYTERMQEALAEVDLLIGYMSEEERLEFELRNLWVESRKYDVFINDPGAHENRFVTLSIKEVIDRLETIKIEAKEKRKRLDALFEKEIKPLRKVVIDITKAERDLEKISAEIKELKNRQVELINKKIEMQETLVKQNKAKAILEAAAASGISLEDFKKYPG
ncbi:hypothetical protein [Oceanisphaera ostreae]|uniref:Uncharacterized protein n=1 Tax=Oceanisphaera ostreae TaxID=914151 RepID=A0ABW3KCA6_9GAMM